MNTIKQQHGLAMVEFAIALPLLLILLVSMAEFGVMFYKHNTLTKAVEDGARFISASSIDTLGWTTLDPDTVLKMKNLVVYGNILGNGAPLVENLTTAGVTVWCSDSVAAGGSCNESNGFVHITVSAQVDYVPVMGSALFNLLGIDLNIPLKAQSEKVTF